MSGSRPLSRTLKQPCRTPRQTHVARLLGRESSEIEWLLESDDPSVRYLTLTEVLGEAADSEEVRAARDRRS